ncbi:MAG: hypothetical protein OXL68_20870 [Paracoccaceae bacterium]|nr:hypothetical protein [Paracoccaceae bacterium]
MSENTKVRNQFPAGRGTGIRAGWTSGAVARERGEKCVRQPRTEANLPGLFRPKTSKLLVLFFTYQPQTKLKKANNFV